MFELYDVSNQKSKKIKLMRFDRGGANTSKLFKECCVCEGVIH